MPPLQRILDGRYLVGHDSIVVCEQLFRSVTNYLSGWHSTVSTKRHDSFSVYRGGMEPWNVPLVLGLWTVVVASERGMRRRVSATGHEDEKSKRFRHSNLQKRSTNQIQWDTALLNYPTSPPFFSF